MINITGNLPKSIVDKLYNLNIQTNGIKTGGDDINVTISKNGTETRLYAIFIGDSKWEIDEIEDDANLFPNLDKADVITVDMITKMFSNAVTSSLILSFNPLGRVKYGIKDKVDKIKDVGKKIKDWATDQLYAEEAEKFIRGNGPYKRTFTDPRDGKTRTKNDYSAGRVNVGKIENMGKQGHYKVLTGNPATQDFQVWELYKNGNKIRCLNLKTGLQAQEAQWVYDNNIPESWTEADWNPEGEIPEKASKIEVGSGDVEEQNTESQETVEQTDNVEEEATDNSETVEQAEEDNVSEEVSTSEDDENESSDNVEEELEDFTQFYDGQYDDDVIVEEDNNVQEEEEQKTKKKGRVAASFIQSENNVTEEPKKKKKSKYNGCNVSGCVDADGGVALASSLLIIENLKDFINYTNGLKNVEKEVQDQWKQIKALLLDISILDKDVLAKMTKQSGDNLIIDFNQTGTGQNYTVTVELTPTRMNVFNKVAGKGNEFNHLIESLKTVKKSLEPKV